LHLFSSLDLARLCPCKPRQFIQPRPQRLESLMLRIAVSNCRGCMPEKLLHDCVRTELTEPTGEGMAKIVESELVFELCYSQGFSKGSLEVSWRCYYRLVIAWLSPKGRAQVLELLPQLLMNRNEEVFVVLHSLFAEEDRASVKINISPSQRRLVLIACDVGMAQACSQCDKDHPPEIGRQAGIAVVCRWLAGLKQPACFIESKGFACLHCLLDFFSPLLLQFNFLRVIDLAISMLHTPVEESDQDSSIRHLRLASSRLQMYSKEGFKVFVGNFPHKAIRAEQLPNAGCPGSVDFERVGLDVSCAEPLFESIAKLHMVIRLRRTLMDSLLLQADVSRGESLNL